MNMQKNSCLRPCSTFWKNKKAGLHYCCSAYRDSGIAFRSKQQH